MWLWLLVITLLVDLLMPRMLVEVLAGCKERLGSNETSLILDAIVLFTYSLAGIGGTIVSVRLLISKFTE